MRRINWLLMVGFAVGLSVLSGSMWYMRADAHTPNNGVAVAVLSYGSLGMDGYKDQVLMHPPVVSSASPLSCSTGSGSHWLPYQAPGMTLQTNCDNCRSTVVAWPASSIRTNVYWSGNIRMLDFAVADGACGSWQLYVDGPGGF